jgi:hypothetical protein
MSRKRSRSQIEVEVPPAKRVSKRPISPVLILRSPAASPKPAKPVSKVPKQVHDEGEDRTLHFLSQFADVFLPVLPESNYISTKRLAQPRVVPFTRIPEQPQGIQGKMKEYQLGQFPSRGEL